MYVHDIVQAYDLLVWYMEIKLLEFYLNYSQEKVLFFSILRFRQVT